MYEDEKYSINWLKIILRVLIAFLVILLTIKLIMMISNHRKPEKPSAEYATKENLNLMDSYAKKTYTKDVAPTVVGSSISDSLKNILDKGELPELKGLQDHCDMNHSYIEVVRLDDELQYTSYLICNEGKEKDTVVSRVSLSETTTTTAKNNKTTSKSTKRTTSSAIVISTTGKSTTTKKPTTTTKKSSTTSTAKKTTTSASKKTTKKTTVKTTTTSKKYTVSYNTNGGSYISPSKVTPGSAISLPIPKRTGYKFVGWYYHGTKFNSGTKINKDYVLVAKWEVA